MNDEERWIESAFSNCEKASARNVLILFRNDAGEVILTNAGTPELVTALAEGLTCGYEPSEDE